MSTPGLCLVEPTVVPRQVVCYTFPRPLPGRTRHCSPITCPAPCLHSQSNVVARLLHTCSPSISSNAYPDGHIGSDAQTPRLNSVQGGHVGPVVACLLEDLFVEDI
jgi:hypothetical protein